MSLLYGKVLEDKFIKNLNKRTIKNHVFYLESEIIHILDFMIEGAKDIWWFEILTKKGGLRVHPSNLTYKPQK